MNVEKLKYTIKDIITFSGIDKGEIRLLLMHVLNLTKSQLITKDTYILTDAEYLMVTDFVTKRKQGVPINYLIGEREFYSRMFYVNNHTLIPRPETELLVGEMLLVAKDNSSVLELGTGSGCIAISCKLEKLDLNVLAVDKYRETLDVAILNAKRLNADITFKLSSWYENVAGKFDFILSNPPYIAKDDEHLINLQYEPQVALTDFNDGLDCIRTIIDGANEHLNEGGYLMIEHGFNQGDLVVDLMLKSRLKNIKIVKDYAGLDRITVGQRI